TVLSSFNFGGIAGQSAESFLLVRTSTPPSVGDDIDANDDGVIDAAFGISMVDGISFLTDGQGQRAYAPVVFSFILQPTAADTADAASRLSSNSTPLTSSGWIYGELAAPSSGTAYVAPGSFPAGANITPGAPNAP